MKRRTLRILLGAALLGAAAFLALAIRDRVTFDREAALADFETLLDHTAAAHANLDFALERRGIDPVALAERTREAIERASTEAGAIAAMREFVGAFKDPHFRLITPLPAPIAFVAGLFGEGGDRSDAAPGPDRTAEPAAAVSALGYSDDDLDFEMDFAAVDGTFERLPDDGAYPAGVLRLRDGRALGVIRIARFGDDSYAGVAAAAWPRFRERLPEGPSSRENASEFSLEVARELLARLAARLREIAGRGVATLLVDVTGNGGGREWCGPAARLFTEMPLAAPRNAPIRHPHWTPQFENAIAGIDAALGGAGLAAADRAALEAERRRLSEQLALVRDVPDRRAIFRERGAAVPSLLALSAAPPLALDVATRAGLERFDVEPGAFAGRLFLVTDRRTGSATEHFVAMLRDANAAEIVGSRTAGAGHGYTNGGIVLKLFRGGVSVRVPDAARLRPDGTNQIAGIEPDRPIDGFDDLSAAERARRVVKAIE